MTASIASRIATLIALVWCTARCADAPSSVINPLNDGSGADVGEESGFSDSPSNVAVDQVPERPTAEYLPICSDSRGRNVEFPLSDEICQYYQAAKVDEIPDCWRHVLPPPVDYASHGWHIERTEEPPFVSAELQCHVAEGCPTPAFALRPVTDDGFDPGEIGWVGALSDREVLVWGGEGVSRVTFAPDGSISTQSLSPYLGGAADLGDGTWMKVIGTNYRSVCPASAIGCFSNFLTRLDSNGRILWAQPLSSISGNYVAFPALNRVYLWSSPAPQPPRWVVDESGLSNDTWNELPGNPYTAPYQVVLEYETGAFVSCERIPDEYAVDLAYYHLGGAPSNGEVALLSKGFLRWAADWRMLRLDGSTGRLEPVWRDLTPANLPTGSTGPASLTRRGTLLYASSMGLAEFDFNGNLVDSRQLWDSPADESWSVMNFGNTADNTTWFGTAKAARVFDGDPMTTGTIRIFGPTQLGCGIAMGDGSLMGGCTTVSAADPSTGRTIWKLRNHGGTAGLHFLGVLGDQYFVTNEPYPPYGTTRPALRFWRHPHGPKARTPSNVGLDRRVWGDVFDWGPYDEGNPWPRQYVWPEEVDGSAAP